jgi:hypothetical protein
MGWHGLIGRIHVQRTRTYKLAVVVAPLPYYTHQKSPVKGPMEASIGELRIPEAVQNHAMQGTGHQMIICFNSPVPATGKAVVVAASLCCAVKKEKEN